MCIQILSLKFFSDMWDLVSAWCFCLLTNLTNASTQKMEAVCAPETPVVTYQTARHNITKDNKLHRQISILLLLFTGEVMLSGSLSHWNCSVCESPEVQCDSKLLSGFPFVSHGNSDNNLESIYILTRSLLDFVPEMNTTENTRNNFTPSEDICKMFETKTVESPQIFCRDSRSRHTLILLRDRQQTDILPLSVYLLTYPELRDATALTILRRRIQYTYLTYPQRKTQRRFGGSQPHVWRNLRRTFAGNFNSDW
jgi:hypothetical protein